MRGVYRGIEQSKQRPDRAIRQRKYLRRKVLRLTARADIEIALPTVWKGGQLFDRREIFLVRQGDHPDVTEIAKRVREYEDLERRREEVRQRSLQAPPPPAASHYYPTRWNSW